MFGDQTRHAESADQAEILDEYILRPCLVCQNR
jgi:hypothetical protein